MTRQRLNRTLHRSIFLLVLILVVSLVAKLIDNVPGVAGTPVEKIATQIYDYLKDMALVLVTVVAAWLANVFQKRSKFVERLEEEWRGIVKTKAALYAFCEKPYPSGDDYIAAFGAISATIDNMRIVYRNAGETDTLIGLYPYAPLHDMRRALQSVDPRKRQNVPPAERKLVQDAILQCFYALRENFLEELDLEQPVHPLLIYGGRRLKQPGSAAVARSEQDRQRARQDAATKANSDRNARSDIDTLLDRLYLEEHAGPVSIKTAPAMQRGREA